MSLGSFYFVTDLSNNLNQLKVNLKESYFRICDLNLYFNNKKGAFFNILYQKCKNIKKLIKNSFKMNCF